MKNCVIKENTAAYDGGGIYCYGSIAEINNCTISCNTAGRYSGGIHCEDGELLITDSILWNNEDISGPNEDSQINWYYDPDISYSCVQGWTGSWGGIGNFGDNPLLEDMNGCGDCHLQEASPCINAGDPNLLDIYQQKVDIDGQRRIMDFRVDIGADEFAFPELIVTKPEGGEVWSAGSIHEIEWSSYLIDGTVDIYLSTDGGSGWLPAAMMVVDDGDYVWQLPDLMGSSECLLLAIPSEPEPEVICIESGLFIIRSDSPGPVVNSRWKTLGGNFERAGLSDVNGPELGFVKWQLETDGPVSAGVTIGFDGRMHIPCEDGKVYTVDANGLLLWSYDVNSPVLSSPTIGPDGTIYVGCENGKLYAIDIDGDLRWTHNTDGFIFSSPAVSEDGEVYVGSEDGILYALGDDGSELWSFQTDGPGEIETGSIFASAAVDSNGTVYIGALYDPNIYALDGSDGSIKWVCDFNFGGWPFASAVLSEEDGIIYQALIYGVKQVYVDGPYPSHTVYDANLYAIDANNGNIIWATEMSDTDSNWFEPYFTYQDNGLKELYNVSEWNWSEPALGPDGTIYVSFDDPYLRAIEPNGTIKWIKRFGMMGGFTMAIGNNGLIYTASDDGYLCVIDPNGWELGRFESYGQLSYPVISQDNTLIVSDANNTVWAIGGEDCEGPQLDLHRPQDLRGDWIVNFIDFALLAERWLECTDKEDYSYYTEELPCPNPGEQIYYISDVDRNLYVDLDDLAMLAESWLNSD
ncbi:PQQ-binding-like beta-propeller repeat protein [Planctomycetota bacterium]